MRLEDLTADIVEPLVGSTFVASASGNVSLELTAVRRLMERVESAKLRRQPFAMYFAGPADAMLPQQTYAMTHEQLGEIAMFIVPVGRTATGFEYEAVFT